MNEEKSENNVLVKRRMNRREQMKELLKLEFPNCFKSGDEKMPLKIGIHLQLHSHYKDDSRFDPQIIQKGLNSYSSSPKYLSKIVEGASRMDINGNPEGIVTAQEAAYAKGRLKYMQDSMQQKLQLKQQNIEAQQKQQLQKLELKQQKLTSKQKESIKLDAKASVKKLEVTVNLSEIRNKKSELTTQPQAKTKEELKKEKQERYAKKMNRRKELKK